jgi:hypothetical protein
MKMNRLTIAALCFMCAGCAGAGPTSNRGGVPLEKVVLDDFHALTIATERQLFEEYVKYKVLGKTFDLYDIGDSSIEVGTTEGGTDTYQFTAGIPSIVSKGVSMTNSYAVNSQDTGKLTIKLSSIANDPNVYKLVKHTFEDAPPGIYETINDEDATFKKVCTDETYCFKIPSDPDKNNYAYVKDVGAFRTLVDTICQLDPPKAAPAAGTDPVKKDHPRKKHRKQQ